MWNPSGMCLWICFVCTYVHRCAGSPGALWEYLYSGTDASLLASCSWWSWEIGEPSLLRHSGVCSPLDGGERSPWWVGDAGALLEKTNKRIRERPKISEYIRRLLVHSEILHCQFLLLNILTSKLDLLCSIQSNDSQERKQREGRTGESNKKHESMDLSLSDRRPCCWWPQVTYLEERGPNGVLKQATPLCRLFLKACSTSLLSEAESTRQKLPLPGSSWERATFRK